MPRGELLDSVGGRDGILCLLHDRIDAELMDATPAVGIANYAVGYNNMDLAAATARGILLSNTPGVLTDATADLAWALLFSTARRVVESDGFFRTGQWKGWGPRQFLGADITGANLGIVGAGRIGENFALKSKGFGMRVRYAARRRNSVLDTELDADHLPLDAVLAESDFVSIHVPLTPDTHHLIGTAQLRLMKPGAILINTARGPIVDESALVEALRAGTIAGAGLDVYEDEPRPKPGLIDLPNVVCVPHIGSATHRTRTRMSLMAAENLLAMLRGERPANLLNPEAWEGRRGSSH
jgi:glyoxylate reductase